MCACPEPAHERDVWPWRPQKSSQHDLRAFRGSALRNLWQSYALAHFSAQRKLPKSSYECRASAENNIPHPDGMYVSGDMVEDAVMRVVLMAAIDYGQQFENMPAVKPASSENGSALEKRILEITERISRLLDGFDSGIMKKEDFQPRYNGLVEERERLRTTLQEKDSSATVRFAMKQALEACAVPGFTVEQARQLVVAFVEKVEASVSVDYARAELPKAKKCRAAWITLRYALIDGTRRVLAPMYDARFTGERVLLDRE